VGGRVGAVDGLRRTRYLWSGTWVGSWAEEERGMQCTRVLVEAARTFAEGEAEEGYLWVGIRGFAVAVGRLGDTVEHRRTVAAFEGSQIDLSVRANTRN